MSTAEASGRLGRTSSLRAVPAIARVTAAELLRDRVLYAVVLSFAFLMGLGVLASRLAYSVYERIMLTFSLASIWFSCLMIGVLYASSLLSREEERRTFLVAMSRPISRGQFLLGKFAGLSAVISLNWLVSSFAVLLLLWLSLGSGFLSLSLAWSLVQLLLQSLMLAACCLFFTTFSTPALSVAMTLGVLLAGSNAGQLRALAVQMEGPGSPLLKAAVALLPQLEWFQPGFSVAYRIAPLPGEVIRALAYAFSYGSFVLLLSVILMRRRA